MVERIQSESWGLVCSALTDPLERCEPWHHSVATVFGLIPWRLLSASIEAFDRCIAARMALSGRGAAVEYLARRASFPVVVISLHTTLGPISRDHNSTKKEQGHVRALL